MNTRATYLTSAVALLLPGSAMLAQDNGDDDTFGFQASLSGAQEPVPPEAPTTPSPGVDTDMTGNVQVNFANDLSSFTFRLTVLNGTGVTMSHLHCARPARTVPSLSFFRSRMSRARR